MDKLAYLPSPSALCPVVGMADCESLREESHLLAPTEEICSPAQGPPFLPQMTVIRRPRGDAYEKPRPRSDLVTELGESYRVNTIHFT